MKQLQLAEFRQSQSTAKWLVNLTNMNSKYFYVAILFLIHYTGTRSKDDACGTISDTLLSHVASYLTHCYHVASYLTNNYHMWHCIWHTTITCGIVSDKPLSHVAIYLTNHHHMWHYIWQTTITYGTISDTPLSRIMQHHTHYDTHSSWNSSGGCSNSSERKGEVWCKGEQSGKTSVPWLLKRNMPHTLLYNVMTP
jgi:hypothetical protein